MKNLKRKPIYFEWLVTNFLIKSCLRIGIRIRQIRIRIRQIRIRIRQIRIRFLQIRIRIRQIRSGSVRSESGSVEPYVFGAPGSGSESISQSRVADPGCLSRIQAKMTKIAGTGSGSIGQRLFCCSLGFGMRGWTNIRFQIRIDTKISWIYIVLRIQDVFPGSRILMIVHPRIPDSKQQQKRWVDKISSHFF